jgi:hypothetical protein
MATSPHPLLQRYSVTIFYFTHSPLTALLCLLSPQPPAGSLPITASPTFFLIPKFLLCLPLLPPSLVCLLPLATSYYFGHCTSATTLPLHGHMAWGGHGLLEFSPGLAMPDPSMPCGRVACGRHLPFLTPHAVHPCPCLHSPAAGAHGFVLT